ncbi:MAG: L,D-transpeptidase [Anaerolineaceae bacterium]|nr:L,D-transpeptidase [Anaerolineaceae bacterium]
MLVSLLAAVAVGVVSAQEATPEHMIPTGYIFTEPDGCAYVPGQSASADCLALIEESPRPKLENVNQDRTTLDTYNFWQVGPDAVTKYDAPGGGVTGQIPAGYNFINAIDASVDGWLQIEGGEWISREQANARSAEPSYFTGVEIPEGWTQTFAWVLDTTGIYASLEPGGPGVAESGYLTHRYDLVTIFAEAYDSDGWRWYMIGPNQWLKQTFVAKVKPIVRPEGVSGHWVGVDLYEQTLIAYEDDRPVFATLIASGVKDFATNEGLFTIWAKLPRDAMSGATGAPSAYALQSVPWVMYFDGSISLHGTYWHDLFGYRHSHGCVNLTISDARYIFDWTAAATPNLNGDIISYVYVYSSGDYGTPPGA